MTAVSWPLGTSSETPRKRVDRGVSFAVAAGQVRGGEDETRRGGADRRRGLELPVGCSSVLHVVEASFYRSERATRRLTGRCSVRITAPANCRICRPRTGTRSQARRRRRSGARPPSVARVRHGSRSRQTAAAPPMAISSIGLKARESGCAKANDTRVTTGMTNRATCALEEIAISVASFIFPAGRSRPPRRARRHCRRSQRSPPR